MSDLFTFAEAKAQRDEGMKRALDHAEEAKPGWSTEAYSFLISFARENLQFISEDVSGASKKHGLRQPGTDRAWGAVYRRAIKAGIIVQNGTGRSARRHASLCPRWLSLIYQGRAK